MANIMNPQFPLVLRQNRNTMNKGYGKYYPERAQVKTISLRGLCEHMASHQSIYSRDVIEGVITKMTSCLTELLAEGNPVKIDGLGTFDPVVESNKGGLTLADLSEGRYNPQTAVKGVHIRFLPEGAQNDKITSVRFKEQCDFSTIGILEPIDLTPDETDASKKKWGHKIVPIDIFVAEQNAGGNGNGNSGDSGASGSDNGNDDSGSAPVSGDGD